MADSKPQSSVWSNESDFDHQVEVEPGHQRSKLAQCERMMKKKDEIVDAFYEDFQHFGEKQVVKTKMLEQIEASAISAWKNIYVVVKAMYGPPDSPKKA